MRDIPLYPESRIAAFSADEQYPVTFDTVEEIAEEALQAFYAAVVSRLSDLYPDSQTTGDMDPMAYRGRIDTAATWVNLYAANNSAVQEYEKEKIEVTVEATDPSTLDFASDGIDSVTVREDGGFQGYEVDIRGTRGGVYDFLANHWGDEVAEEMIG